MKLLILTTCSFFILLLHSPLLAYDFAESLQTHGFFSQGFLKSNNNNLFVDDSIDGTFAFTDVGLNANLSLYENWRIGGQLFYRNLGDYNEDGISIDWAIIDYKPFDFFGMKVGKVKMPIGLYNETRDADFSLPMIFLPQSVYDESRRDLLLAYVGGGVYGNVNAGSWGDFDYHLFLGDVDFPSDSVLQANVEKSIKSNIDRNNALPPAKRNPDIPSVYGSVERDSDHVYGGAVIYNSEAITGLRLGFSFLHSKYETFVNGSSQPIGDTVIHGRLVVSADYSWKDFVFVSEYCEVDRTSTTFGKVNLDGPSQAWYGMVSYSPFEQWTFSTMYDQFYPLKHDKDGSSRPQISSSASHRKDIGLGVRWEINEYWVAKAEYHWIDGTAMQLGTFNPDGTDRYWHFGAARISFVF